jgi:uncharacterized membrane protein
VIGSGPRTTAAPEVGDGERESRRPFSLPLAKGIAAILAALYAVYFSVYTCISHRLFHTYAYDLGTFDQGIWLAGHSWDHFVTVRGLPLLGDHVRLFSFVLAPLYWVVDDVRALLVAQSVAIALGAWFVLRIALRELPGRPWAALALSAAWLLHPAVQNLNLDHAHPDAFASTLLLAAVDALRGGRTAAFAVAAALAMSCKEDVPLVFAAMGVAMLLDPARRRFGAGLALAAGTYFALCMLVILPHYNGVGFFRFGRTGFLWGVGHHAHDPSWFAGRLFRVESVEYLWRVAAPFAALFLLAPLTAAPALPALTANLLSDASYMRSLDFHYMTSIVPFLLVAGIDASRFLAGRSAAALRMLGAAAPFVLLVATVAANDAWSKVPLRRVQTIADRYGALQRSTLVPKVNEALSLIPPDAVVSAHYSLVPQLSHRQRIYLFPNPFEASNWAIEGENPHDPEDVEYVVLRNVAGREKATVTFELMNASAEFDLLAGDKDFGVYRRRSLVPPPANAGCGDWDDDGEVSASEVRVIADAILKQRPCPMSVCDADGDGVLAAADSLLLHRHSKDPTVALACPR